MSNNGSPSKVFVPGTGGYYPVPKWLHSPCFAGLNPRAKHLYAVLQAYCSLSKKKNKDNRDKCWPSHERLAKDIGGVHRITVVKYLNSLKRYGLIDIQKRKGTTSVFHLKIVKEADMSLPIPKRIKRADTAKSEGGGCSQTATEGVVESLQGGVAKRLHKYNNKTNKQKESRNNNSGLGLRQQAHGCSPTSSTLKKNEEEEERLSPQEVVDNIKAEYTRKANDARTRVAAGKGSVDDIQKIWNDLIVKELDGVRPTAWNKGHYNNMKRRYRVFHIGMKQGTFVEFLEFTILNWRSIAANDFKWMNKTDMGSAPITPSVGFFISFFDKFLDAWYTDEDTRYVNRLPQKQRRVAVMKRGGVPHDLAVEIAEEEDRERKEYNKRYDAAAKLTQKALMIERIGATHKAEAQKILMKAQRKERDAEVVLRREKLEERMAREKKIPRDKDGYAIFDPASIPELPTWEELKARDEAEKAKKNNV